MTNRTFASKAGAHRLGSIERLEDRRLMAYTALATEAPPVIDGLVSPGEWNHASAAAGDFVQLGQDSVHDPHANQFRILWDNDYLYLLTESGDAGWSEPSDDPLHPFEGHLRIAISPAEMEPSVDDTPWYEINLSQRAGESEFADGIAVGMGVQFAGPDEWLFDEHADIHIVQTNDEFGGTTEISIGWGEFDGFTNGGPDIYHPYAPQNGATWQFNVGRFSLGMDDEPVEYVWSGAEEDQFGPYGQISFDGQFDELEPNDSFAQTHDFGTGEQFHAGLSIHEPGNDD